MGLVFEARQISLNRTVALKMMRGDWQNAKGRKQFKREARAIAGLDYPHIVKILDTGEVNGNPYYTMNVMAGGSLAEHLDEFTGQTRKAVELVATIAEALGHVHDQGIVHRDIKHSNILLDAEKQPHLSDFGLCRDLQHDPSTTIANGNVIGTPMFLAPEQIETGFGKISPATDVYSLGVVLFHLVVGRPPFEGKTPMQVLWGSLHKEPDFQEVPDARLTKILRGCLAKHTSERYTNAGQLAEQLVAWLGQNNLRRPILGRMMRRFWRRAGFIFVGILCLSLIAALRFVNFESLATIMPSGGGRMDAEREKIEETLAITLLEQIYDRPTLIGSNEYVSFWQIASLPLEQEHRSKDGHEKLRERVLRLGFASDKNANRLINRAPYLARALVGLDETRRRIVLDDFIDPILKNPSATSTQRLAAVRIGLALNNNGIDFAESAVSVLTDSLVQNQYPALVDQLSSDLIVAIGIVPALEKHRAFDPIIVAIQQTNEPHILQKLYDAIRELHGKLSLSDQQFAANRLILAIENEVRPEIVCEFSKSLVRFPTHLNVINAGRGVKYIIHAIEKTKRAEVRNSLVAAIKPWSQRLTADDFKATEDEILEAIKRAQDSETMAVFAQCLAIVAVHHSQSDIRQATNVLLEAMSLIYESDSLYELCKGLSQLSGKISENDGRTAISRLLKVMAKEGNSKDLSLLAKSLCTVPVPMTDEENAEATKRLLICISNSETLPPEMLNLTNGLSTLPNPLSLSDSQQLFDTFFRSLDRFQRAVLIHKIQESMQLAGRKLTASAADLIAEEILKRMESYWDTDKIRALAYGLRGMESVVNSSKIKLAYQIVRDKLRDPSLNQPLELSHLAETLSIIPEDIPESIAEDAIDRMLAILVSIENSEIVKLVAGKLGFVGGDISKTAGHQAVTQILDRIQNTKESSHLRRLSLGLAFISIGLKDFTENDAAEVAKYLALAMDVSSEPQDLIQLGQALEKIAPKLPKEGDQAIVRLVVEQNLKCIQAIQSPEVIEQLARILQAMSGRMTKQQTRDAIEQILLSNMAQENIAARRTRIKTVVAMATASKKSHENYGLEHLLLSLPNNHDPETRDIILDGVEKLAEFALENDFKHAKAAILAIAGDHNQTGGNEEVLNRLIRAIAKLPGGIDLPESIELLKSPFSIGAPQRTLLTMIGAQTNLEFGGNPWKLVASAIEVGIDPKIFVRPATPPQKLILNLPLAKPLSATR